MQEWVAVIRHLYDYVSDMITLIIYLFCLALCAAIGIVIYHFFPITTVVVGGILVIGLAMIMVEEWQACKKCK